MGLADFAGFGVAGYRSFSTPELQLIGPIAPLHLVVGRNNVGKSNTLRFAHQVLRNVQAFGAVQEQVIYPGGLDQPGGWDATQPKKISLGLHRTGAVNDGLATPRVPEFQQLLSTRAFNKGHADVVWFDFTLTSAPGSTSLEIHASLDQPRAAYEELQQRGLHVLDLRNAALNLTGSSSSEQDSWDSIVRVWAPWSFMPPTIWIDAIREIRAVEAGNVAGLSYNGSGLIDLLAALQNPPFSTYEQDAERFQALQAFVKAVLEDESARIEVPSDRGTILVHSRNGVRPLDALGTGVAEVLILASAATGLGEFLVCIEEPEVHLHPTLQRKLVEYLRFFTRNHYLISTHSAALLNSKLASITHLTMPSNASIASPVISTHELSTAVFDLGNRAADIVQSNYLVWVEGPSDRIYLRSWISFADAELMEGIHYSVMFYGGALLNHLTADDSDTNDLIKLLRINRHLAVVIDSDRATAEDPLNGTKIRVVSEVEAMGGIAWVTAGYTIENAVPLNVLRVALKDEYPYREYEVIDDPYKSPLGNEFSGSNSKPNKVAVARRIVAQGADTWSDYSDGVREAVLGIVQQIRRANDL